MWRMVKQGADPISYGFMLSELGLMVAAFRSSELIFLQFGDSRSSLFHMLKGDFPQSVFTLVSERSQLMRRVSSWMNGVSGKQTNHSGLSLALQGTRLQQAVWCYLQTIPRGEVRTYAEVAKGVGAPRAVRAVASACAKNRIALVVPCHRVVRSDGSLGGYRWGLERKKRILEAEGCPTKSY